MPHGVKPKQTGDTRFPWGDLMKKQYLLIFLLFLMTAMAAWVTVLLLGFNPLEVMLQKKKPLTQEEREAAKTIDEQYYLGKWISGEVPYEELLAEKGGWLLNIKDIRDGELQGSCYMASGSPKRRVVAIKFQSKLAGNQTQFEFTDSLFNKGHAKLSFHGRTITLNLTTKLHTQNQSGWSINGKGPPNRKIRFEPCRLQPHTEILQNIMGYLNLPKDELIRQLGDKYRVIPEANEYYDTFSYPDLDIAFAISYHYDVLWVTCGPGVDINGVRAGMNFAEIMDKLGTAIISGTFNGSPSRPLYEISYLIGTCRVMFQSPFKDGRESEVVIVEEPFKKTGFKHTAIEMADPGESEPGFPEFRGQLLDALRRKDVAYLLEQVDGHILFSPNSPGGKAGFINEWGLDNGPDKSEIWNVLAGILRLGGVFDKTGSFTAPYTAVKFPGEFNADQYAAATGGDVNVYYRPSLSAAVIAKLHHEIVGTGDFYPMRTRGARFTDWRAVTTASGRKGFVLKRYLHGPRDYRATFQKVDGLWRMVELVRGE
jgi:hypothetical protein